MKLLPNKTFPHPVLWGEGGEYDDYVQRKFQATCSFELDKNYGDVSISYKFVVSEEEICKLINDSKAVYVIEINCPQTLMRHVFTTNEQEGQFPLGKGKLHGRTEMTAFIVCTEDIENYSSKNFNPEFGDNATFNLLSGDILATIDTDIYEWNNDFVKPLHSVFELVGIDNIEVGMFDVDISGEKVKIQMNPRDKNSFESIRQSSTHKPIAMLVYFAAVTEVLYRMKSIDSDVSKEKKWYRAIKYKLGEMGQSVDSMEPFNVSQKLLNKPLKLALPKSWEIEMDPIKYFKQHKVDSLRAQIKKNLPWYCNEKDALALDLEEYGEISLLVDPACFETLNNRYDVTDDKENIITIYQALNCLSLQQATDERIWTYLTHVLAKEYTSKRWNAIPEDDEKAVKYIEAHYFVTGVRGLIRDNAVARLWWMGHVASRCKDYSLEKTLSILLKVSDVRANLLERPFASASPEVFSGIIRVLGKVFDSEDPAIYQRKNFREFMKRVNQQGGRIMFNALNSKKLDEVFNRIADEVINSNLSN